MLLMQSIDSSRCQVDSCAGWWTQEPDAAFQLARDMGYSAARYGHVMFPENVYEPALRCAELLLEGVGKGWASRTYYSDNGSTAVEITLKMAFHKFSFDQGIALDSYNGILGGRCYDFKLSSLHSFVIVVVTCLIGLQFGHVIVHLKDHRERIVHWTGLSLGLLKLGFVLDFFGIKRVQMS
ncbi:hypothetical protein J5N97_026066 [Dioscorea zingiberensis]|uniref:Uncharacterized protein n=1 Tax=Dioscorea zingiberensis TaxID=325984 RepID=A0A9D5C2B4_9LILI|nr:hypothetical protein J5N97_026066 [Dioscorea zingiberensis]